MLMKDGRMALPMGQSRSRRCLPRRQRANKPKLVIHLENSSLGTEKSATPTRTMMQDVL